MPAATSCFAEHTRCPQAPALQAQAAAWREPGMPEQARRRVEGLLDAVHADGDPDAALAAIDVAIEALRRERYIDNRIVAPDAGGRKALVRRAYYALRPLLPVAVRKHLQRAALSGWDRIAFPRWPVDTSVEELMDAIWHIVLERSGVDELPFIWYWPDGHAAACMMTHDVETQAGRDFCATMMGMESRVGLHSSFEIVPEQRYEVPESYLQEIRERGCEVCLHGLNHDGHLFDSEAIFFERAPRINAYARRWGARGFRSPVMYRNPDWMHALEFAYDMSLPNVGHLDPQRGGCCTVMPYFIGNLLELPLTTMQDYSLFNILRSRSLDTWNRQIELIRARHGLISFIVHPDYVGEPWSGEVYARLLDRLAELRDEQQVWLALPRDIDAWWRARRDMRLVDDGGGRWRIEGAQAERARVAYAARADGRIVYRVDGAKEAAPQQG